MDLAGTGVVAGSDVVAGGVAGTIAAWGVRALVIEVSAAAEREAQNVMARLWELRTEHGRVGRGQVVV